MPDCNYCGESFEDEEAYLGHLDASHERGELSRIDRRRVENHVGDEEGGGLPTGPLIIGGLILFSAAVIGYTTLFMGDTPNQFDITQVAQTPADNVGAVHEHGTINVTIDGETLDFSQPRFQNPQQYRAFHFEGGNGDVWHKHASGVTLEYGMKTLGIEMNESAILYDGELYKESDPGTEIAVTVNGEEVDPSTYELQGVESTANARQGDHVRIVVRTDASGGADRSTGTGEQTESAQATQSAQSSQ